MHLPDEQAWVKLPADFDYCVVKPETRTVTCITCPDFDTANAPGLTRKRRKCGETDTRANGQDNQIVAESALVLQTTLFSLARQASMRTKYWPMNYRRVYPCLLVRQVDQFDRLNLRCGSSYYGPFASLSGKSQSLVG